MITSRSRGGLLGLLAIFLVGNTVFGQPTPAEPGSYFVYKGERVPLVPAPGLAAIEYHRDKTDFDNLERARAHAKELGVEIVQTQVGINNVIVAGDRDKVASLVAAKSDISAAVKAIRPVFYFKGVPVPEAMVVIPDRVIVAFTDAAGVDERAELAKRYGLAPFLTLMENTQSFRTTTDSGEIPALAVRIMEENPGLVKWAEPAMDRYVQLHHTTALPAGDKTVNSMAKRGADPLLFSQWHLFNTGTNTLPLVPGLPDQDLDVPRFWNPNTRSAGRGNGRTRGYYGDRANATSVVVAVLDTGTNLAHEDWDTNQADALNPPGFSRSVLYPTIGFDYVQSDPVPDARLDSHGTAVAGIIAAARNNGRGVVGIAPSSKILTMRVFNDQGVSVTSDLFAAAVTDATNQLADVGNHSYGGLGFSNVEEAAFRFSFESGRFGLGMANFVSSGNNTTFMSYPALFEWNFSVGGVDDRGQRVSYASYGGKLDFVGPTQQPGRAGIVTTDIMGPAGYSGSDPLNQLDPFGNYTDSFNGTSASGPTIAGVGALLLSEYPNLPVQPYLVSSVMGWQTNLFRLMAQTADRPPNQHHYFPAYNNASSIVYDRLVPESDFPATETAVVTFGNPGGFRRGHGYRVDGFSHYFGYGRPNPYNAVTQQWSPSPYRDYIRPSETDHEAVDYGELFLAYRSNFRGDYEAIEASCRESLTPESGTIDAEALLACIRSRYADWQFTNVTVVGCETSDEPGLPEMHYASPFLDLRETVHRFEFGPTLTMRAMTIASGEETYSFIANNVFPYVIHQAIPTFGENIDNEFWYNPRGRYLANRGYEVRSNMTPGGQLVLSPPPNAAEDFKWSDVDLILEITIKHDLSVWNGSAGWRNQSVSSSFNSIQVFANNALVGTIQGSSHNEPIFPVIAAVAEDEDDCRGAVRRVSLWNVPGYIPAHEGIPLLWRTYRFPIPGTANSGGGISVRLTANTNNSYLPEWDFSQSPANQITDVAYRDNRGFQIGDIRIWGVDPLPDPVTGLTGKDISRPPAVRVAERGTLPVWSAAGNEVLYVNPDPATPTVNSRVMVAYSDGMTRVASEANPLGVPIVTARESIPLFRTCSEEDARLGLCTPAPILSTNMNPRTSRLLFVVDTPPGKARVFTATDDGFDPQPVFPFNPATMTSRIDAGVREAIFARKTETLVLTDNTTIFTSKADGTDQRFVIDTSVLKATNFRDLSTDDSDQIVSFTATTRDGHDDIFYTIRGVNQPGFEGFSRPLVAWPFSNEVQGQFSPDGRRFAFSSNAFAVGGGTTTPAPGAPYRIYIIDNIQDVIFFMDTPDYTGTSTPDPLDDVRYASTFAMRRDNRLIVQPDPANLFYVAGSYPRFSPTGSKLTFVGFLETNRTLGEIAIVDLPARTLPADPIATKPPAVTPAPTPTPFPTEPPQSTDNIVQTGQYVFDTAGDGWIFVPVSWLAAPSHSTAGGSLQLVSQNNNALTFGSYVSPPGALRMFPFDILGADRNDFEAGMPISPPLEERQGPLYLLRYYVRRTNSVANQAATLRLRVNSENFEDYHLLVVNSRGTLSRVPTLNTALAVDMLFQPNPWMYALDSNRQAYRLAFDLLNIEAEDDPNAGFILDRVDIFRVPRAQVETLDAFKMYTFSAAQRADWTTHVFPTQFAVPTFSTSSDRLEMTPPSPADNSHGMWQNIPGTIMVDANPYDGALFVQMTARAGATSENPFKVPEMRFRLAEESFQAVAIQGVVQVRGHGTGKLIPTANNERLYRVYLKVADDLVGETRLHAAWDLLSFESLTNAQRPTDEDTSKIYLDSLQFELIRVNNYPAIAIVP